MGELGKEIKRFDEVIEEPVRREMPEPVPEHEEQVEQEPVKVPN
jgi:hypothetical protein